MKKKRQKRQNKTMEKNTFMSGAFVSTLGIVISKILGIVYVVPFHAMVGAAGGALYGYAYSIYAFFIGLSTAGIPLSVSKVTSHYEALGYYDAKRRVFVLARRLALLLGVISFLILMIFAPVIAKMVIGDLSGGNSLASITLVIRIIALAVLIVPILSIYRGYMQGHMIMTPPSISQVIEQLVRVLIIIFGSFLVIKVFKQAVSLSVGVALLGAFVGAVCSYIYLRRIYVKHKKEFKEDVKPVEEPFVSNKEIIKLILIYAVPFIMIDVVKAVYDLVDMATIVKSLVAYADYTTAEAESVMSIISTWGKKFNMIVISVTTGIIMSLIPSLSSAITKKDHKDINNKINESFSLLFLFGLPMAFGIAILAYPIWNLFYGSGSGASTMTYYIFVAIFMSLFTLAVTIIQLFKDFKVLFWSMLVGLIFKALLNVNLISSFAKMGLPPIYGSITATIIGFMITFIICMVVLYKKYDIKFDRSIKNFIDVFICSIVMSVVLLLLNMVIPVSHSGRLISLLIIVLYAVIGVLVYGLCSYKIGVLQRVTGNRFIKIFKKN